MTKLEFIDKINDILVGLNTLESDLLGSLYDELMRSQWIPVEERLPEEENLYIVSNGKETSVAYWVEDEWDSFGSVITHWMPLPAAPRKE